LAPEEADWRVLAAEQSAAEVHSERRLWSPLVIQVASNFCPLFISGWLAGYRLAAKGLEGRHTVARQQWAALIKTITKAARIIITVVIVCGAPKC